MSKAQGAIEKLRKIPGGALTRTLEGCAAARAIDAAIEALQLAHNTLEKVSAIRDSIIACSTFNWSEHAYPLVAALDEAGYAGAGYNIARNNLGTLLQRLDRAEAIARTWHAACDQRSPEWYADAETIRRFDE